MDLKRSFAAACLAVAGNAQAADLKPCEVLTEGDVKAALGAAWSNWKELSKGEFCAYRAAPTQGVTLILTQSSSGAAEILAGRRQLAGDRAKAAAGPGEGAHYVRGPKGSGIVFGKGRWVAQIEASTDVKDATAALDKLAAAAYARLK